SRATVPLGPPTEDPWRLHLAPDVARCLRMDNAHRAPISTRTGRHYHAADIFGSPRRRGGAATATVLAAYEPELVCAPAESWCAVRRRGCGWKRAWAGAVCPTGRPRRARRGGNRRTRWDGERKARRGRNWRTRWDG